LTRNALTNSSAPKRRLRGYLAIAAAALCWGACATVGKAVFSGRLLSGSHALRPIDPLILAQTRISFALLVLAPLLWLRGGRRALTLPKPDVGRCMLLGTLGVAASNFFYYFAIAKTTVATAIIVQYTAPVLVLVYLVARGQQRATAQRVGAVAAAVAGCALAIGIGGHLRLNAAGIAAATGAAFSFAFYNVYGHRLLVRYDRWRVMLYTFLGGTLFWLLVNPPWKIAVAHYSAREWVFLLLFSMGSMLVPFSFYFAGLHYLDATRAIVTSCLEPVFAIVLAAMFVAEPVQGLQVVGIVLVLIATIVVQIPNRAAEPATEAQLSLAD
jgi:drug/metabolite transporter (DMT)-like permease